jgi:hypothetical protein
MLLLEDQGNDHILPRNAEERERERGRTIPKPEGINASGMLQISPHLTGPCPVPRPSKSSRVLDPDLDPRMRQRPQTIIVLQTAL